MKRRSRIILALAGLFAVMFVCAGLALIRPKDDRLLHEERIFAFRDAVLAMNAPPLFSRGALAYTFHDWPLAERDLLSVARAAPWWSRQGFAATDMLANIYLLSGRNAQATAQGNTLGWHNLFWPDSRFAAFGRHGDLTVATSADSQIRYAVSDNQMYIPVSLNGQPANYLLDTGASGSFLSESEARRLGLKVDAYSSDVQGFSETERTTGLAITDLAIGGFRLRNVPFQVQPDQKDTPVGTIGLPVLLALETLRWGPDGILEVGFPAGALNPREANLGFADRTLLASGGFGNGQLDLHLDSGAGITRFYPRFSGEYADYLRQFGHKEQPDAERGFDQFATTVPQMRFVAGGSERTMWPARVLLRNPSSHAARQHGMLGFDFLSLAGTVTLDFRAMKITMAGEGLIMEMRGNIVTCRLPRNLVCEKGWTCVVKSTDDGCQLDRLPDTPWPGNAVALHRNPSAGHRLDPGFRLRETETESIVFRLDRPGAADRK